MTGETEGSVKAGSPAPAESKRCESIDGPEASRPIDGVMAGGWLSERLGAVLERARFDPAGRSYPPTAYVVD
jgi:hypothetical protein